MKKGEGGRESEGEKKGIEAREREGEWSRGVRKTEKLKRCVQRTHVREQKQEQRGEETEEVGL